jgi:hypothetical protein
LLAPSLLALLSLLAAGCGGGGGATAADAALPRPDASGDAGPLHEPHAVENALPGDDWNAATHAALRTLEGMYSPQTGVFNSGYMWTWASGIEVSLIAYEGSGGAIYQYLAPATRDLRGGSDFLEEFGYDDQAWWGDAWIRAYDVTGNRDYLDLAGRIFADMRSAWDEASCGGGVWWNPNHDFKNAVTAELAAAAAALCDYFGRALPLHVLDEEESLRPRLLALPDDALVAAAVERMHAEHGPIERLVAEGLACWRPLALAPGTSARSQVTLDALEATRPALTDVARALADAFDGHLAGEERDVFPAIERLPGALLVTIRAEMKQRRTP